MENDYRVCRRCLLRQADARAYETVAAYVAEIPPDKRANDALYEKRLAACLQCSYLSAGLCTKCGCYAEMRAAFREKSCADYDHKKW